MAEVLLVDDDGSVLLTLAIALRRQGHHVTVAGDAFQAMTHLKKARFDFMISDVRMPGVSGLELAATARDLPEPPRVILTSAYPFVEDSEAVSEAFMQKPLDVQRLSEYLNSAKHDAGLHSAPGSSQQNSAHAKQTREAARAEKMRAEFARANTPRNGHSAALAQRHPRASNS